MITKEKKITIHEDWIAVILGFLIIISSISGVILPLSIFKWNNLNDLLNKVLSASNLSIIFWHFVLFMVLGSMGTYLAGKNSKSFIQGFPLVYVLTTLALIIAGNEQIKGINLEAVIFSLVLGLVVSNFFKLPEWFRNSLSTELFVKIGLILLGCSVIFSDILKAGSLGLLQALIVVFSVWYVAFWLCKKLKVDSELTMMISSAVSICGVSAAIATCGAIKGDPKKLSSVISMVLVTAIPMMILMPYAAHYMGLSQEVTGAWLGGTIDTSGAVVAAGTLVGEVALKISTIVKFSQNVLLGIAAFAISIYWTYKENKATSATMEKPTLKIIWERFPKFVLGFIVASLLFSFVFTPATVDAVKGNLKYLQGIWFALAFTSIGLETNFADFNTADNRKGLYAFLLAQTFNVIITLIIAKILFS